MMDAGVWKGQKSSAVMAVEDEGMEKEGIPDIISIHDSNQLRHVRVLLSAFELSYGLVVNSSTVGSRIPM
jgi:hypothetical protein